MIPVWWSWALTTIGLAGLALVYARPASLIGPLVGIAVQGLWITYAVATLQFGFIVSALGYGAVNIYGLRKRRLAKESQSA